MPIWPTSSVPTANLDANGDVPANARPDILTAAQNVNLMKSAPPLGSGINPQSGTTYSIATSDTGKIVSGEHATNITITLLAAATAGDQFRNAILAGAAGTVSVTGTVGAMVNPVLQPGETLVYWGNATIYEGFVCPAYHAAVSNYASGRLQTVESNIGVNPTEINIHSVVASATWEDIGPTGAANAWSALDDVPLIATYIKVRIITQTWGNSNTFAYITTLYTRNNGDSTGPNSDTQTSHAELQNRSGSQETDGNTISAEIPIDSANKFEAYWVANGPSAGKTIAMRLVGWGI